MIGTIPPQIAYERAMNVGRRMEVTMCPLIIDAVYAQLAGGLLAIVAARGDDAATQAATRLAKDSLGDELFAVLMGEGGTPC